MLALDVPTGLLLDEDAIVEPAVRATATLTLALPKRGLRCPAAHGMVGALFLADLSIPPAVYAELGLTHRSPFGQAPVVQLR